MGVNLGNAYGKIIIDGSGALSTIGKVRGGLLGLPGPFGLAATAAAGLGVAMGAGLVGAGAALTGAIASSVNVAADLESQLSGVQAVTGATTSEMKGLKDLITDLGVDPKLKVSALEAAAAIEMLGRNGMAVQEIMDGAARSTVLLANATGGDFAQSADIATDVMTLWKIEAADMERAVNGITGVVNNSKFAIGDYQLAIAQAGGVAATSGVPFEEFNTVIAGTAPLFASGSDAGTSFKTFLQRLVPQSKDAAKAIEALNLEFFDAQGNLRDMGEISEMLREKLFEEFEMTVQLGGATKEMADAAKKANTAIPGLTATIAEQEGQLAILQRELAATTEKYGENSIQADKKRLAIQKLTNDLDANRQTLTAHQNALTAMADATVETISTTTKLTEEQRNNTLSTIFGTDAMRTAVGLAALGADGYNELAEAIDKTSAADAAATRMDNLSGTIEILSGIVETLKIRIGDEFVPLVRRGIDGLANFLSANQDTIVGFFAGIADWVGYLGDKAGPVLDDIGNYVINLMQAFQTGGLFGSRSGSFGSAGLLAALGLDNNTVGTIEEYFGRIREAYQAFKDGVGLFDTRSGSFGSAGILSILGISQDTQGTLEAALNNIKTITDTFFEGGFSGLADLFWQWITGEEGVIASTPGMLSSVVALITRTLDENWPEINTALTGWSNRFWDWLLGDGGALQRTGEAMTALLENVRAWGGENRGELTALGEEIAVVMLDGIKLAFANEQKMSELLAALGAGLWAAVFLLVPTYSEIGGSIGGGVLSGMLEYFLGVEVSQELQTVLGTLWSSVLEGVLSIFFPAAMLAFAHDAYIEMKRNLEETFLGEEGVLGLQTILESMFGAVLNAVLSIFFPPAMFEFATGTYAEMRSNFEKLDFGEIGQNIINGIIAGIKAAGSRLIDAAVGAASAAYNAARSYLGIQSPSTLFAGIGENISLGMAQGIAAASVAPLEALGNVAGDLSALAGPAVGGGTSVVNNASSVQQVGDIYITGGADPQATAKAVRRELENLFGLAQRPAFSG